MMLDTIPAKTELKINLYNIQNPPVYTPNMNNLVKVEVVDFVTKSILVIIEDIPGIEIVPPIISSTLTPLVQYVDNIYKNQRQHLQFAISLAAGSMEGNLMVRIDFAEELTKE